MKLYQEHSVNPLGSCLPLVLQLPFFLALFYLQQSEGFRALVRDTGGSLGVLAGGGSLAAAAQVKGGEKFLFIPDLTVAATGGVLIALIIIYITTQMGSSAVSASAMTDKNQKRLIFALPFLFTPFIISFPAGLLVYWITTNTWTIGQQLLVRKVLPPPHLKEAKEGEAKPEKPLGRLASMLAGAEGKAENRAHLGGGHKEGDGQATASGGAGAKASGGGRSKSPAGGADSGGKTGGRRGSGAAGARAGKGSGGGDGKTSGDGGNGRTQKAPPPSPRKKKKRSGRRR
jgi:YidC/Oxa1 family membrane protein insertase